MTNSPKWTEFPKYPVVAGIAILAVGVTLAWWAKVDVSMLFETAEIRRGQFWRLATAVFLHLDILHLIFNLYWLWIFGTAVERVFGHAKTAFLVALFAIGANSFDFAFDSGGVGLSGVGYGLFGLLYILSARDERFRDAIDGRTSSLFVGWFFFCVLTTVTHVYVVANVAHGAGAILGMLTGLAITLPSKRILLVTGIVTMILFGFWGDTIGRPIINLSGKAGFEEGQWGYQALLVGDNREASRWLSDAVRMQPKTAALWFDLGIAYQRLGDTTAALSAYKRAHELDSGNPDYSKASEEGEQSQ